MYGLQMKAWVKEEMQSHRDDTRKSTVTKKEGNQIQSKF